MITIPIGNNVILRWSILFTDDSVFPLSEYDYELSYTNSRGRHPVSDTAVVCLEDNELVWRFDGTEQLTPGRYSLTLKVLRGGDKVATFNYASAFSLTSIPEYVPHDTIVRIKSYTEDLTLQSQHALTVAYETRDYLDEVLRQVEEGNLVKREELEAYAKKSDLNGIDLTGYVTKSELDKAIQDNIITALNSTL